MNNTNRKHLQELAEKLRNVQIEIEQFAEEEQEKHDNLSEGLQESEMGQKLQEISDEAFEIGSECEDLAERIDELIQQ